MHDDGSSGGARLEDPVRLIVVHSPDAAAPLIDALDVAGVGAWMWVEAERALYLSPGVLALLGMPLEPGASLVKRFLVSVHPDDQAAVKQLLAGRQPAGNFRLRYRFTPAGGPLRWIEDRGCVERDASGRLVRQGGAMRDVTREVGRELESREADARLEALINAMPFGVWGRSGPAMAVTHQNAESIALWGDLRGSALSEAPEPVRKRWQAQIADVMTGEIVRAHDEHLRDGQPRIYQQIVAPVVVEDRVTGVVGVAIDVTEEERARGRAQEAQKLESLGVLAGGIAHDFNNLLTAILGNASLLRMEAPQSLPTLGPLDEIEAAAQRAAELCRQMLAYAGRGRFALHAVDLNEFVRDIEPLLLLVVPTQAEFSVSLSTTLPPVLADANQLRQLVMNLVVNAAEALRDGMGTISIATSVARCTRDALATTVFSPDLPTGDYVSLTVRDNGEGMTPETISRIFDPFFTTRFHGRGLGLAAAVGIVRAHQGALRVESAPGSGSTFEILLPAYQGATTRPAHRGEEIAGSEAFHTTGTALVVDDEMGVRTLARSVLERTGMKVLLAENGHRAIEIFQTHADEIGLVLIDLTMPGLSGHETLASIRDIRPEIPAILMSGFAETGFAPSSDDAFLPKPFTPAAMRAVLARVLRP
jgi:signal transduction histidine kinase/CheY-like chemotaxis protein